MKMTILKTVCVVAVMYGALLAVSVHRDNQTLKRGMPPGYYLECDDAGHYRACHEGRWAVFCLEDPSTKAAAIRRAWDQYEYDEITSAKKWSKVNDR